MKAVIVAQFLSAFGDNALLFATLALLKAQFYPEWSPNEEEDRQLREDWEELMDMIVLGQVERITARHGEYLQIRPKAANAKALTEAIGARGERILTLPRGFYLKKNFTSALLARHFLIQ